jgi:O-antigen/teichoic acid export membrane protein
MKRSHLSNAAYNVLEYVAQPTAMLVAAPMLLHRLGTAPYGLWLIASAVAGTGSVVSAGFGDAIVRRVASFTASGDREGVRHVIRTMLVINLLLGAVLAVVLWLLTPVIAGRVTHHDTTLYFTCLRSLRLGAPLIVIKAVESVFVSAQKAYQHYGPAVRIGLATRMLTVAACIALALGGQGVVELMLATVVVSVLGASAQAMAVRRYLGSLPMRVKLDRVLSLELLSYGGYTWLQAISGVIFSQADRLILGATLGPSAVAYYGVAVQMALPIHGLTAAGLHFLFPYLASHFATDRLAGLRRPILTAFTANALCAALLTTIVVLAGPKILARWMGSAFAMQSAALLPLIALGFGLLALNVTAHYSLMALGRIRIVTLMNVAGGALMLLTMTALIPVHGVQGAALSRLWYGPVTCLLYLPLLGLLRDSSGTVRIVRAEVGRA